MRRLIWLTDLHWDFAEPGTVEALLEEIRQAAADAILVGGDIGEADSFPAYLQRLAAAVPATVYFVLGNHDYYRGSLNGVREAARQLSRRSPSLHWLPEMGVVRLTEQTCLLGHGGWADGRIGRFRESNVLLNDYVLIEDLQGLWNRVVRAGETALTPALLGKLHALGDEAATHFRDVLPRAAEHARHLVVLTHVPPFHAACWHEGELSDENWAPHFTCRAVGEVLVECMQAYPEQQMTVLCGHTHSPGRAAIRENLEVHTGGPSMADRKCNPSGKLPEVSLCRRSPKSGNRLPGECGSWLGPTISILAQLGSQRTKCRACREFRRFFLFDDSKSPADAEESAAVRSPKCVTM